jgi:hypothetical protein
MKYIPEVGPVGKETAVSWENGLIIHRRYIVSGGLEYNLSTAVERKVICHADEAASWFAPKRGYDRLDFGIAMNGRNDRRHFERSGSGLECGQMI